MQHGLGLVSCLYRCVRRQHKASLPGALRELGDSLARSEFQSMLRSQANQAQWREFFLQWRSYLLQLGGQDVVQRLASVGLHAAEEGVAAMAGHRGGGDLSDVLKPSFASEQLDEFLTAEQKLRLDALHREAMQLSSSGKGGSTNPNSGSNGSPERKGNG